MGRQKGKAKGKAKKKMVRIIDMRVDVNEEKIIEESSFRALVEKEKLICYTESFITSELSKHDSDNLVKYVWCPAVDPQPGDCFTTDDVVRMENPSELPFVLEILEERKLQQELKCTLLQKKLIEEEEAAKEKKLREQAKVKDEEAKAKENRLREQVKGKGMQKASAATSKGPSVTYTDLRNEQTHTVSASVFRAFAVNRNLIGFNYAAYDTIYEVPGKGKGESSSTMARFWHSDMEWEEFLTEEHIFVEVKRPIHNVLESSKEAEDEVMHAETETELEHADVASEEQDEVMHAEEELAKAELEHADLATEEQHAQQGRPAPPLAVVSLLRRNMPWRPLCFAY